MGGTLHHAQGYRIRVVSLTVPWWPGGPKLLAYQASTLFSSLANRDIFAWQHMTYLDPTKELINPTWRTLSLLPSGQSWRFRMATCEFSRPAQGIIFSRWLEINTSSIILFTGSRMVLRASLLKGSRSHTSSNTSFTGLRLVLRGVYCMGLAPILSVLLRLLVHDWYYMQVCWTGLAPIPPITLRLLVSNKYSMLLKGPRSNTSSNAQTSSFQPVFYVTEGASLLYFQ
jgi:hypothetical protein